MKPECVWIREVLIICHSLLPLNLFKLGLLELLEAQCKKKVLCYTIK